MEIPFHPLVRRWFSERFTIPTSPQQKGWRCIAEGKSTLIAAPTGSGKTLAAFLWSIDRLIRRGLEGRLEDKTSVVYVSPLKALGNDIEKNLKEPLSGIIRLAESDGMGLPEIRVAVRSGDTPARERQAMLRRPPHILITTPESLYILLTAELSRQFLRSAETAIIDEIHAIAGNKRGSHLALSLERLEAWVERPLQRIGLSATQKPIEEIARLLVGSQRLLSDGRPDCAIVDIGHKRDLDLRIETPDQELGPIATQQIWAEIYDRIVAQVGTHRTTLVFVNTRRLVERVAHQLTTRLGEGKVGAHHGSLSRQSRLEVEDKLKSGELPVVVATASLELGIDIGHVDVVCNIGSPRTLAMLLQRVGRSGHGLSAIPKGIFYPLTRDDLMQCVAACRAVQDGELDQVVIPEKPLDILAQQMVATVASMTAATRDKSHENPKIKSGIPENELWELIRKAYPYRSLTPQEFKQVLDMLAEGIASRKGRRSAFIHRDRVHKRLRARRGARLAAITNGGAIPDTADYDVVEFPKETFVGKVNEDFAIESLAGDIFLLGNHSWRIRRVSSGKVWVEDAQGLPPSIPFWLGEAPGRTLELSQAVSRLRADVVAQVINGTPADHWLVEEAGVSESAAEQIASYVRDSHGVLGCVPTNDCIVAERFFDEAGGMQLVLHAPFGGRINRAWGLALRKRFCVSFDRELQAAATDDGIVLSLGEEHSFPLGEVFQMVRSSTVERELVQAVLASPIFANRWRWNATRSLAVARHSGGRKVPVALQRMRAEDLLGAVFPEQLMCQDNRVGPVELPDHPLVCQTIHDCLHEAMDIDGLTDILGRIERGEVRTVAVETRAPSPMCHEILNANPYAFLDDAPLEERRARAVSLRRTHPELARGLGVLSEEAIQEVCKQAWPDIRNDDELHDLLLSLCALPVADGAAWSVFADELIRDARMTVGIWHTKESGHETRAYVPAERLETARAAFPEIRTEPAVEMAEHFKKGPLAPEEAVRRIVQGWLEVIGPVTASNLAERLGLPAVQVGQALLALESAGVVLRGEFTAQGHARKEVEWCERGLLSRIHRLTLGRLRREIEPVSASEFITFLLLWQHVCPNTQMRGREGILEIIGQLQGLELPAPAWEQHVLPARVLDYDPDDLESLCLGGLVSWGRLRTNGVPEGDAESHESSRTRSKRLRAPTRVAPIAFLLRDDLNHFVQPVATGWDPMRSLPPAACDVGRYLERFGASFLSDIARGTGLLKVEAEEALWQLVAQGLVTGDGIAGLRVLITPEVKRRGRRQRLRVLSGGRSPERLVPVGRWSLWRGRESTDCARDRRKLIENLARQLLRRYGVVFRDVLQRESCMPSWRSLLEVYRRLEERGEIRGGRFVNGFVGEQFALPEAVDQLRALRRSHIQFTPVIISCADPLNLVGILSPGSRVSPFSGQSIVYSNGVAIDVGPLGALRSRLQQRGLNGPD